jgi:hypothetical protein
MQKFLSQDMHEQVGIAESVSALNEVLRPMAPPPAMAEAAT